MTVGLKIVDGAAPTTRQHSTNSGDDNKVKRITLILAALVALGVSIIGAEPAAAALGEGRAPYCSGQDEHDGREVEPIELDVYVPERCRPIPEVTWQDHVCGFQGYVKIPEHDGRLIDYFIDDVEVDEGQHPQALGAEVHVTAEVKFDGNDETDAHWDFVFSTPDCTGPEGPAGEDGEDGEDGAPGPAAPAPARPIFASPRTTG